MRLKPGWKVPLGIVAWATVVTLAFMPWQATLREGNARYLLDLPRSPVWRAPGAPSQEAFESMFQQSFGNRRAAVSITVGPNIEEALALTVTILTIGCVLCVPFYFWSITGDGERDQSLRVCVFSAAGVGIGLAISVLLWIVLGGWGPSGLTFFAICGLLFGAIAAFAKPRRREIGSG